MTQGIVIEVKENYSIVLAKGQYYRVVNKNTMVEGTSILFTEEDLVAQEKKVILPKSTFRYASVAAVMVLVLVISLTFYNNQWAVYTVVTLDINPSIALSLNKEDEVIEVEALNEDGQEFVEMVAKGTSVEDAIDVIVEAAQRMGFIKVHEETFVIVTTVAMKEIDVSLSEGLNERITSSLLDREAQEITYVVIEATNEDLLAAKTQEIPLPVLIMQKKKVISTDQTVKEMTMDPLVLNEMAEEGIIIRGQLGKADADREKLEAAEDAYVLNEIKEALLIILDEGLLSDEEEEAIIDYLDTFDGSWNRKMEGYQDLVKDGRSLIKELGKEEKNKPAEEMQDQGMSEDLEEKNTDEDEGEKEKENQNKGDSSNNNSNDNKGNSGNSSSGGNGGKGK